jgi:lipopolysaccharide biosynthesis glycosyltransferase
MRLFLSGLLDENVNRLLYLDADTIINGALDDLVNLDMGTHPLAMAMDSLVRKHKQRLGFQKKDYYYNSGVILFQMKEWKKRKCSERIMEHIKNVRSHYPSPDQDLLNVVCKNEIFALHPKYNMQPIHLAFSLSDYYLHFCRTGYYPVNVLREAVENPIIFHFFRFVGEFPWDKDNLHPDREVFDEFLLLSPWKDYVKTKAESGILLKIEKRMYQILPKSLFIILFKFAYEYFIRCANRDSLQKKINRTM